MPQPTHDERLSAIQTARELFHDEGVLEIDDAPETAKASEAMVSAGDNWQTEGGGMYVKAWVWVQMI